VVITAHVTEVTGKYVELIARAALMANGWTVHTSETEEAYDILATCPTSAEHFRIQVKTIQQRDTEKRKGELVVHAKKGNRSIYAKSEVDYFIGVWAADSTIPRVYMFENREIGEYWASEARASERWIELPLAFDRTAFTEVTADAS